MKKIKNTVAEGTLLLEDPTSLGSERQVGVLNSQEGVSQGEFLELEQEFAAKYQAACNSEHAILKAKLSASVAAHRLGVVATELQPLVEAAEGKGSWTAYLKRHGMAIRTVQRAQRIARCMGEEQVSKLTLEVADETAAAIEAVERGNAASVDEWREVKKKLADLRAALDKKESDSDRALAETHQKLDAEAQEQYAERVKELEFAKKKARQAVEAEAEAQAEENAEAIDGEEMAEALKDEGIGIASIPAPRALDKTMPPEVAAALEQSGADVREGAEAEDEDTDQAELLTRDQISDLAKRLKEIVTQRPNDLTDAVEDPRIQEALDQFVDACNGDPEITFAVVSAWAASNVL